MGMSSQCGPIVRTTFGPTPVEVATDDSHGMIRDLGEGVLVDSNPCARHRCEGCPVILAMEQSVSVKLAEWIYAGELSR